ncbi:MAG TPA: polyphosphate kinase 2 [Woeseiaceae bacterium]|nr:polyphosphate kinase 2 [Woeseiaceae bacterium]
MNRQKIDKEVYEDALDSLQADLARMQRWVKESGARIVVVFEGRDTAGKGGVIKRITERVSPRVFKVVALPAPSDREKTQFYYQRYARHLPSAGEVILFDRSWYNRAGVERVMGFCTDEEYGEFMRTCPGFEHALVESGIQLIKYFLDVGPEEQEKRFRERIEDPCKHWKLSDMDLEAIRRYYEYSRAYDEMFAVTHTEVAPWHIVDANSQKRARLNCIAHLLDTISWHRIPYNPPVLPEYPEPGGYRQHRPDVIRVPERW